MVARSSVVMLFECCIQSRVDANLKHESVREEGGERKDEMSCCQKCHSSDEMLGCCPSLVRQSDSQTQLRLKS